MEDLTPLFRRHRHPPVDTIPTETSYDAMGRTVTIKYPDNETVTYLYDAGGNLQSVSGYVTYASFNAMGQPGLTTYANGVTTQ